MVLADDTSPAFMARGMNALMAMMIDGQRLADAFRADGGFSWGDHHECLFRGTEWFFRPGYRAFLTNTWIPALDGVEERLLEGARVADVGCGHGASVVVMADTYPNSTIHGFDFHAASIETAKERAKEAGSHGATRRSTSPARRRTRAATTSSASSTASTTWATRWASRGTRVSTWRPAAPCCSSSRWRSTTARDEHRREPARRAALHRVVGDLHAELAVAGGRPRSRRAGRRGAAAGGVRGSRIHPLPAGDRVAPEHDPRGPRLRSPSCAAVRRSYRHTRRKNGREGVSRWAGGRSGCRASAPATRRRSPWPRRSRPTRR